MDSSSVGFATQEKIRRFLINDFARYSLSFFINDNLWGLVFNTEFMIKGHLGVDIFVVNFFVTMARDLVSEISFGICAVASIILGKEI